MWYCWWKKSCTTWDVSNGKFAISAGAGFLPSTVSFTTYQYNSSSYTWQWYQQYHSTGQYETWYVYGLPTLGVTLPNKIRPSHKKKALSLILSHFGPPPRYPPPESRPYDHSLLTIGFPFVKAVLNPLFLASVRWRMYINWLVISHKNMWSSKVERLAEVGYWARHSSHTSPSFVLAYFPYLGYHMTAPKKGLFCHQLGPLIDIVGDHIPIMAFDIVESIICKINKKISKMPNSLSGLFRSFLGFKIIALLKKWKTDGKLRLLWQTLHSEKVTPITCQNDESKDLFISWSFQWKASAVENAGVKGFFYQSPPKKTTTTTTTITKNVEENVERFFFSNQLIAIWSIPRSNCRCQM